MATFDKDDTATTQVRRFCPECGHAAGGSNFYPSCGHNMGFAADRTVADPALRPPAGDGQRARGRLGFLIAGVVLGLVAIAVAAIVLLNSGSKSGSGTSNSANASVTYKQQLTKVLAPLVGANQAVSASLTNLNGSSQTTNTAKTKTTEALSALSGARGGLAVLKTPAGESTLSGQVQQALTADDGYLQAVSSTLATPTGTGAGQLQTLSTGAQSAFVNLNSLVAGASASVSGTDNLVKWAQGASNAAKNAAKKDQAQAARSASTGASSNGGSAPAPTSSTPSPTPSGLSACDQNISVNASTTTCQFADAVFAAYAAAVQGNGGPMSTTVTASSSTTGQTYQDYCAYNSTNQIVECSHGTDLIQFPEWAAAVYNG
jgi:hypothetical protein